MILSEFGCKVMGSLPLDVDLSSHTATFLRPSNLALAQMAFEDAYLTIQDVDGVAWADKLRTKMHDGTMNGESSPNETTWLKNHSSLA